MWDALKKVVTRFEEIERVLSDPSVTADRRKLRDLSKERAQIEPTIRALDEYRRVEQNIRDDEGYWKQIEVYIRDHSEAKFSHGICPSCAKKLYPQIYSKLYPDASP